MLCSKIRKTAFRFLTNKGPGCSPAAAATMMATTKEAKLMCHYLRNRCIDYNSPFVSSVYTRNCTFEAMFRICEECSDVKGSTRGTTATKLIDEDKNPSENGLLNKVKQRNKINKAKTRSAHRRNYK